MENWLQAVNNSKSIIQKKSSSEAFYIRVWTNNNGKIGRRDMSLISHNSISKDVGSGHISIKDEWFTTPVVTFMLHIMWNNIR